MIHLGVVHAVAGFDFSYGYKGTGNMDRLKSDSGGLIEVTKVAKVECQGEKISSTCIRERLLKGNVEELPDFLGRPYEVKCDWDGFSFSLNSILYTACSWTLCGYVEKGMRSIQTEMIVMEDQVIH